jgi:hypothetical protein
MSHFDGLSKFFFAHPESARNRNRPALKSVHSVENAAGKVRSPIAANCYSSMIAERRFRPTKFILRQSACQAARAFVGLGAFEPMAAVGARSNRAFRAQLITRSL